MNLSALKTFAPAVRVQLMEAVTRKLDFVLTGDTADLRAMTAQRESLRRESGRDRDGLVERVAYTWFNRIAALRFMDAHGWHPFGARVITPASPEEMQPEILRVVREGRLPPELSAHTDASRLNRLLDGAVPSTNPQGEVYRHLVLAACRFYHALLPTIFEKLDDETELLLPDDLLTEHSVVHGFRVEIADDDCAEVEILGWLYQFYISEKKDQVMARKSAVPTEDIPAVTQLFTPHWIVRYLVENSLGRLWLLNRPGSRLREHMPYYIEGEPETDFLKITKPEEIRLCDPAVGSGHMLTYAFDLLTHIYEEEGYAPTEIPRLILRHNLNGLEICCRAAQLAELALVFKAREKSRRFFQPEHFVRPRITELSDVGFAENELHDYIHALGIGDLFDKPVLTLLHQFEQARNFGSLIQPCLDEPAIAKARRAIEKKGVSGQLFVGETHVKVLRVFEQAEALSQRYHVTVANPPYMGGGAMNASLVEFASVRFPEGKADLFAVFLQRCFTIIEKNGYVGMITPPSWLFLPAFEDLRVLIIESGSIESLLHMGRGIFGIDWGSAAFVLSNKSRRIKSGRFFRLHKRNFQHIYYEDIAKLFLNSARNEDYRFDFDSYRDEEGVKEITNESCPTGLKISYTANPRFFRRIPGSPMAYWASEQLTRLFDDGKLLGHVCHTKQGIATGDNDRFLRFWFEVGLDEVCFTASSSKTSAAAGATWYPYSKGGPTRKWYGNLELVVNWKNEGREIRSFFGESGKLRSRPQNLEFQFREAATWSLTSSSGRLAGRYRPLGFMFDINGMSAFPRGSMSCVELTAILCSNVSSEVLRFINPTLAFQSGDIARIPIPAEIPTDVVSMAASAIGVARADWDNCETSWDFHDQPLLRRGLKGATLEASWRSWAAQSTAAIHRMQELETEINRLFIAAYGLDGELQPEVPEEQITLARAEARRDMAAFLSYAVGCIMGRYSLDHAGLILANAGDTVREFLTKVGKPLADLTFTPDEDGIIPMLDGEWFEDDIVARTRDFLRAAFGEATLNENIRFIEEALGKDLRKYFLTDFYKNHLSNERAYGYKKRPIYWLFRSPKGSFAALVYLHRMTRDTPNRVLNRYLRDYLKKLGARIEHLNHVQSTSTLAREKTAARKERDQLKKTLRECEEWERDVLLPLAQSRPELDLDDGVKVNYLKFGDALAPIPGLAAAEEE